MPGALSFFVRLANFLGSFVCIDENTANGTCMDIARVMMKIPVGFSLRDNLKVGIDI